MSVLLRVEGDANTGTVPVEDEDQLVGEALIGWAAHYSRLPADHLVVVRPDTNTILDPAATIASYRFGFNDTVLLMTIDQAAELTGASAVAPPGAVADQVAIADQAAGSEQVAIPTGLFGVTTHPPAPPEQPRPLRVVDQRPPTPPPPAAPPARPAPGDGLPVPPGPAGATRSWSERIPTPPAPTTAAPPPPADIPTPVRGRRRRAAGAALRRGGLGPAQPFAVAERTGPMARARRSMRDSDRQATLERIITSGRLPGGRCLVIVVVSPKGGVGKSTNTALLGSLFADLRRDPVFLVDANPDFGNLARKLSVDTEFYVDDCAAWLYRHPGATPAQLRSQLGAGPHGLAFLATPSTPPERMVAAADYGMYSYLLGELRKYAGMVIVDCGTGVLDPPAQAALQAADQIVLVTDSSASTAELVVHAAAQLPAATPIQLVANRMPAKGALVDLPQVRQAVPNVHGLTVIPDVPMTENVVVPAFEWRTAPGKFQLPVRELAARLVSGWADLPDR